MNNYDQTLFPFESKWISIEGNRVHYVDEGEGDVILFSHAPIGSSFMYREFVQVLRKRYRCIALDYPGFGLSEACDSYDLSLEGQSQVLKRFVLDLELRDIYVMGHDTGGASAFSVAIDLPERFKGLILTDTIIYPTREYPKIDKILGIVGSPFFSFFSASTNLLVRATFKFGIKTRKLGSTERREYRRMFNTHKKRRRITKMLFNLKQSDAFMKKVKIGFETILNPVPTLLIYGENDPVNEMGIADRIHSLMPNSELFLIKDEGHFPHEGQPRQMSNLIHQWIAKI